MNVLQTMIEAEKAAAEKIKKEQGDYIGREGLLFCGKCNTPKQVKITMLGMERTPPCLCKCAREERDRIAAEEQLRKRVKQLRIVGFPDDRMLKWNFANDDKQNEKISNIALNYVENFDEMKAEGKGLLLFGDVDTGKSFIAACIANALIDKGIPCYMTNFTRIRNTLQGLYEDKQQYIDGLNKFDLLVIDDLAAESDTEYMNEIVFAIIDSRVTAGLPLIITTNLTREELKHPADMKKKRIYSRLYDACFAVEVTGVQRRKQRLKNDTNRFKEMLGL